MSSSVAARDETSAGSARAASSRSAKTASVVATFGLIGTVLGLIEVFIQISEVTGYATPVQLSRGVYQSLVTTAGGLVVGVPAYLFYSYLTSRVGILMHDMERAGIEIVNLLDDAHHHDLPAEPAAAADAGSAPTA